MKWWKPAVMTKILIFNEIWQNLINSGWKIFLFETSCLKVQKLKYKSPNFGEI